MTYTDLFADLPSWPIFQTLLPDFLLAFTFFTALTYAVLGKHFGHQRPAVAMSAVLGIALAIGFVWWEQEAGWSVRNLGPLAIGFAVIILGMVMFQAIRQTGGSWAGAGIALGSSILVAWALGFDWPIPAEVMQTLTIVALIVGAGAFLTHRQGIRTHMHLAPVAARREVASARHDLSSLYADCRVSDGLQTNLHRLREEALTLDTRPQEHEDVMLQLRRMLPAEGWLTSRLAELRANAHHARLGHADRINELREAMRLLPSGARHKVEEELIARYEEIKLDKRLERLDRAVAETERRIKAVTKEAQDATERFDHRRLVSLLEEAEKLQNHNSTLIRLIDNTERKLASINEYIAKQAQEGRYL